MRRHGIGIGAVVLALGLAACTADRPNDAASDRTAEKSAARSAQATLIDRDGQAVGTARLSERENGVLIAIEVQGLPQGRLGYHIHAVGRCEPPAFQSAGGHFNPGDRQHGMENPSGVHAGDLPNLRVGADGTGKLTVLNPHVSLSGGPNALLDDDGAALMIHAGPDDYFTDPAGDSGDRIACGVIEPS